MDLSDWGDIGLSPPRRETTQTNKPMKHYTKTGGHSISSSPKKKRMVWHGMAIENVKLNSWSTPNHFNMGTVNLKINTEKNDINYMNYLPIYLITYSHGLQKGKLPDAVDELSNKCISFEHILFIYN